MNLMLAILLVISTVIGFHQEEIPFDSTESSFQNETDHDAHQLDLFIPAPAIAEVIFQKTLVGKIIFSFPHQTIAEFYHCTFGLSPPAA